MLPRLRYVLSVLLVIVGVVVFSPALLALAAFVAAMIAFAALRDLWRKVAAVRRFQD